MSDHRPGILAKLGRILISEESVYGLILVSGMIVVSNTLTGTSANALLTVVVTLALLNEFIDYWAGLRWDLASSAIDLLNTILWPSVLFLLARRPGRA